MSRICTHGAVAGHCDQCDGNMALSELAYSTAHKDDAKKARMDLLPPEALEEIARVFGYGAEKYSVENWRKGLAWSRLYAAALRHLNAWKKGEDLDPESGFPHLAHAGCCVMMLLASQEAKLGEDDRWRR